MVFMNEIIPPIAYLIAMGYILWSSLIRNLPTIQNGWMIPAIVCILLIYWTVYSLIKDGIITLGSLSSVAETQANDCYLWIAISIGWTWILPQAQSLKMNGMGWAIFVLCTGSIGLSAMMSRILYLKERRQGAQGVVGELTSLLLS